jgi:hypothetical protein
MAYMIHLVTAPSMPKQKVLRCVSVDKEVLMKIKAYAPVGNRNPVNKPYVINTNRSEELATDEGARQPLHPVSWNRQFYREKNDTNCKAELCSSCSSNDNEETADEMTSQGQRSGHIPASAGLKRC